MTITITEAAVMLGTTEANVRAMVCRRRLEPVRRGARPLQFDEDLVLDVIHRRRDQGRLRSAADAYFARVVAPV